MANVNVSNSVTGQKKMYNISPKTVLLKAGLTKEDEEAPYRALIGVVIDGKIPVRCPKKMNYQMRKQTGLTNRWRLPESLYSDLLSSNQALKAVNVPFNQNLVKTLVHTYPSINPALLSCVEFPDINARNWSVLRRSLRNVSPTGYEDE